MSRYKEGLEVYQNTEKLLFDEMGVAPSERLLKRFKLMGERTSQAAGALSDIKERLREKEAAVGAYFCPFPSFVDIYHVFSRRWSALVYPCLLCFAHWTIRRIMFRRRRNVKSPNFSDRPSSHPYEKVIFTPDTMSGSILSC